MARPAGQTYPNRSPIERENRRHKDPRRHLNKRKRVHDMDPGRWRVPGSGTRVSKGQCGRQSAESEESIGVAVNGHSCLRSGDI